MASYWHFIIMIIGGIETAWLGSLHTRGLIKWEPIWVIFVCWVSYMMDLAVPDAQWAKPELANGEYLDWQRACGWMATCPVLILFLVSMTTFGGREASVRVVPLLVANQVMFLAGLTSAICTAPARWWWYGLAVAAGTYVFTASAVCFRSLFMFFGDQYADSDGRTLVIILGVCFFVGWPVFPLVWTCGHSGVKQCGEETTMAVYLFGDLLSKNLFVIFAVILKVRYLTDQPKKLNVLIPGWSNSSNEKFAVISPFGNTPRVPTTTPTSTAFDAANAAAEASAAENGGQPPLRRRRPSMGNIAIDDFMASFSNKNQAGPAAVPMQFASPQANPPRPQFATHQIAQAPYQMAGPPPSNAYGTLGAPATTVQAQAMQAVLARVQELVVAHANLPANATHWSNVLEGAGAKVADKHSKVKEYEAEVAHAMQKLTQARSEMLQIAVQENSKGKHYDDESDSVDAQEGQRTWLSKKEGLEEEDTSTPASPLLDPPTAYKAPSRGSKAPPVEFTPRGRLAETPEPNPFQRAASAAGSRNPLFTGVQAASKAVAASFAGKTEPERAGAPTTDGRRKVGDQ